MIFRILPIRRFRLIWVMGVAAIFAPFAEAKSAASEAWKQIVALNDTIQQQEQERRSTTGELNLMKGWLEHYIANYRGEKNWWDARLALPAIKSRAAAGLNSKVDSRDTARELEGVLSDPELPADVRPRALAQWIFYVDSLNDKLLDDSQRQLLVQRMEEMGRAYPKHPLTGDVQLQLASRLATTDPVRCEAALKIAERSPDEQVAARATRELAILQYRRKPLDLKFTAADGRKVDLAELRGKVVLVDFWATWCGPCRREVPNVVKAYQKYQAQGFEVIGVSLDESKSQMTAYTKEQGMTWPQYFDGQGWDTKLSRRFAITSIPTMWLLDREGRILSSDVWGELDDAVKRALAN